MYAVRQCMEGNFCQIPVSRATALFKWRFLIRTKTSLSGNLLRVVCTRESFRPVAVWTQWRKFNGRCHILDIMLRLNNGLFKVKSAILQLCDQHLTHTHIYSPSFCHTIHPVWLFLSACLDKDQASISISPSQGALSSQPLKRRKKQPPTEEAA